MAPGLAGSFFSPGRDCHADTNAQPHAVTYADAQPHTFTNAISDANANANAKPDTHAITYAHPYGDSFAHSDA